MCSTKKFIETANRIVKKGIEGRAALDKIVARSEALNKQLDAKLVEAGIETVEQQQERRRQFRKDWESGAFLANLDERHNRLMEQINKNNAQMA